MTYILAAAGLSEAGKSTVGLYFEEKGFLRLKIADFYREVHAIEDPDSDFHSWSRHIDRTDPARIARYLASGVVARCEEVGAGGAVIESLYGDVLASHLREAHGDRFSVLFVSASESRRGQRQLGKFSTRGEAFEDLRKRDGVKVSWGALGTMEIADHTVVNNGSLESYLASLDNLWQEIAALP